MDHRPLAGFESRKVQALLVYLAVQAERSFTRDELASLFWPDFPDETARKNLRQALSNLRHTLGDTAALPSFLHITRDTIQWNQESDFWLDVAEFRRLLSTCAAHNHRHPDRCHSCTRRREQAADLYRGDFLTHFYLQGGDPFEEWLLRQRESLSRLMLETLDQLAAFYEANDRPAEAQHFARWQLQLDPWREEAHRQLMRALAASGQRNAALAHYQSCRRMLEEELGVQPTRATLELFERIRDSDERVNYHARVPESNLPRPLTSFIGRVEELAFLSDWLEKDDTRLVTLTGPGGVGKTRLAIEAVRQQATAFDDGVFFVNLTPIARPELLVPAIAQAVALPLTGQIPPEVQLRNYLANKQILLLLDNAEHLLSGGYGLDGSSLEDLRILVADLLAFGPALVVLVTSRERLGVGGEWVLDVTGLPVESELERIPTNTGDGAAEAGAAALFLQGARRLRSDFQLTAANWPAVRRICQLVEGLPLAVELAAAWVRHYSCDEIADLIESGSRLLSDPWPNSEQARLITVFERSWQLLTAEERQLMAALSVFRGGFDYEEARQVSGASSSLLVRLVDKSQLRRGENGRYGIHPLLHQYVAGQLASQNETGKVRARHLACFLSLAEAAEPLLKTSRQHEWLERLAANHDNIRAALVYATEYHEVEQAARLVSAMGRYWQRQGHLSEGQEWLETVLRCRDKLSYPILAKTLYVQGVLAWHQGRYVEAQKPLEESVAYGRQLNDPDSLAYALTMLGFTLVYQGKHDLAGPFLDESVESFRWLNDNWGLAFSLYQRGYASAMIGNPQAVSDLEESLRLFQETGDSWGISLPLYGLGYQFFLQEDFDAAHQQLQRSLAVRRETKDRWLIAQNLNFLGEVARCQHEYSRAADYYGESRAIYDGLGSRGRVAIADHNLAYAALDQNDLVAARSYFMRGIELFRQVDHYSGVASCIEGLAQLATKENDFDRAVKLLAAAQTMMDTTLVVTSPADNEERERTLAITRQQLSENDWQETWKAGTQMTVAEAISLALAIPVVSNQC